MSFELAIWKAFRGVSFVFFIFYSTYFGTIFLITPMLPMFFLFPRMARSYIDRLIWFWKLYCVATYEVIFQTQITVYGKVPPSDAATLMIMNHRTRFDWLYLFSYQVRHASVRQYTISLKNMLKFMPGIGWAMQMAGFIFLDRNWEEDQQNISKCLKVFKEVNYKPQILLFPEGTDLTKNTKRRSDEFAEKHALQKYTYVLHPRTTGFTHFVQQMKHGEILEYLVDITIAYPGTIPQTELDIIQGRFPAQIEFLVTTYPRHEIPQHEDDLDNWCREKWAEKENILRDFYEKKAFNKDHLLLRTNNCLINSLYLCALVSWSVMEMFMAYILWTYPQLWIYVAVCTLFYCLVSKYTKGFNILIANALNV